MKTAEHCRPIMRRMPAVVASLALCALLASQVVRIGEAVSETSRSIKEIGEPIGETIIVGIATMGVALAVVGIWLSIMNFFFGDSRAVVSDRPSEHILPPGADKDALTVAWN